MKINPSSLAVILFSFLCPLAAVAQQPDTAIGKIVYQEQIAYSGDSNATGLTYFTKNMLLYFGKEAAIYQTEVQNLKSPRMVVYQGLDSNKVDKSAVAKQIEERLSSISIPQSGVQYYKAYKSNQLTIHQSFYGEEYIIADTVSAIKWNITTETKAIAGFECRKATCTFRGRNYTAWFTTDIPVSVGPWKLNGLPGAILVAEDDKHQVAFTAVKISLPSPEKVVVEGKFNGRNITRADFRKAAAQKTEDMKKMAAGTTTPGVKYNVSTRRVVTLELDPAP